MSTKTRKKTGTFGRAVAAVIVVLVLVGAAALISWLSDSSLKDTVSSLFRRDRGDAAEELYYDTSGAAAFADVDGATAVLSAAGLQVYGRDGAELFSQYTPMYTPAIASAGKYAAAYDVGGDSVIFFSRDRVITTFSPEGAVIAADVNEDGYVCIVNEETGYKSRVTVYDRTGTALFRWFSGSGYVLDAAMRGSRTLAILVVDKGGSSVVFFSVDSDAEQARYESPGVMIDIGWTGDRLAAVSSDAVVFLTRDGVEKARWDMAGSYLKSCVISDSFAAVVTGDFLMDTDGTVSIISPDGTVSGTARIFSGVTYMDGCGDDLAVLSLNSAAVLKKDGSVLLSAGDVIGSAILCREDGSAVVAGAYSARVLIPQEDQQ